MKVLKSLLFLSLLIALSSCTIYDNNVEGQADVVYSSTIVIQASDFEPQDEFITLASYNWEDLDEETVDYGLVMGYIRFSGTTSWQSLPLSVPFENDLVNLRYNFDISLFELVLEGEVANNNQANAALFDEDTLRVIAIPPSSIVRAKGFDYNNYEQVVEYYNIRWNN